MNNFRDSTLRRYTLLLVAGWWIVQWVLIVLFWGAPQSSDAGMYLKLAQSCFDKGEWYPKPVDLYDVFIWAPGFINYLILQLHCFGTMHLNAVLNLLMNTAILAYVYVIARHFFSERTALLSVIVFCLLYSNLTVVLTAGTEVPFLFLMLSVFVLVISKPGVTKLLFAGLLLAMANWIRPFVPIFLPIILAYLLWKKRSYTMYLALFTGLMLGIGTIGAYTWSRIGHFSFQSTTSGNNLIQTAHDRAYGGIMTSIASDTTGPMYIRHASQYTVFEKDSIWISRSMQWIKEHPYRYGYLYVKKWFGLYAEDSWTDRPLTGQEGSVNAYVVKNGDRSDLIKRFLWMGVKSIPYYVMLVFAILGIWYHRNSYKSPKILLFLLFLMGSSATCLFVVGPRYHYPYLFVLVIFAASALERIIFKDQQEI